MQQKQLLHQKTRQQKELPYHNTSAAKTTTVPQDLNFSRDIKWDWNLKCLKRQEQ